MNLRRLVGKLRRAGPTGVFIHSAQHSGSTWLGYVLGSDHNAAFVGELYRAWSQTDRVPCTICAARGLQECVLLGGIEDTDPAQAFSFISARTKAAIIGDNSKRLDWTRRFTDRPDQAVKFVHLIQDPRNVWASVRRRGGDDIEGFLAGWCSRNRDIADFTFCHRVPAMTVVYDALAASPDTELQALFEFVGLKFHRDALRYWTVEHHGFAANGGSSSMIAHRRLTAPPAHYATGDDRFYESVFGRQFLDDRWKTELSGAEKDAIIGNPEVRRVFQDLGYHIGENGIDRV